MIEYTLVRCHALKTRLLSEETFQALISADDVLDVVDVLNLTDYKANLAGLTKFDAFTLERIFNEKLVERYAFLMDRAEGRLWKLVSEYGRRMEVQNITRVLRSKASETPVERASEALLPIEGISNLNFGSMLEADDLEGVVKTLKGTVYESVIETLDSYRVYNSLLPVEYHLKSIYYRNLMEALRRVPRGDRAELRWFIGTEIDVTNCLTCAFSTIYDYDEEFTKKLIIPYPFKIPLEVLEEAIHVRDAQVLTRLLRPYAKIVDHILKGYDDVAEIEALRYVRDEAMEEFMRGMSYAYVLSCLFLCEVECRDLTFLVLTKHYKVEPKEVVKRLISLG